MKHPTIIADNLLTNAPVAGLLQSRGVELRFINLTAGHYRITDKCTILHVYTEEFTRWIAEKTIYRRITELKRAAGEPVVIVEGQRTANGKQVSAGAWRGALAFVAVHNRIPVLFAGDENETADLIYAMANQVQNGMGLTVTAASESPSESGSEAGVIAGGNGETPPVPADLPEQIVRLLPYVGPITAKAMLKRFGNLRTLFSANAAELTKVDGIGPKKAKKIAAFFAGKSIR